MTWQMHDIQWCSVKMCTSRSSLLDGRFVKQEWCQCRGDSAQGIGSKKRKNIKMDLKNICYVGTYSGSTRMFLVVASWVDPEPQDNSCWKGPQSVSSPISYSKHDSSGVRLCCSGMSCLINLQGWELHSLSGQSPSLPDCLHGGSFSSLLSTDAHDFFLSHPALSWGAWFWLLINPL